LQICTIYKSVPQSTADQLMKYIPYIPRSILG